MRETREEKRERERGKRRENARENRRESEREERARARRGEEEQRTVRVSGIEVKNQKNHGVPLAVGRIKGEFKGAYCE